MMRTAQTDCCDVAVRGNMNGTIVHRESGFGRFWFRVTACHLVTYFIAGIAAYSFFDYRGLFQSESLACFMRPISSKWIAAGPALQVIRGLIIAAALYPVRHVILGKPHGWLKLSGVLVGLSVLSTAGPAPGSVEGLLYTQVPWPAQLRGLPEVILQNVGFAALLTAWYHKPNKAWGIVMGSLMAVGILMSIAGVFAARPETFK